MRLRIQEVSCSFSELCSLLRPSTEVGISELLKQKLDFADYMMFCSGRAALTYALKHAGIGPSDEVLIPAYTCHSVEQAVDEVSNSIYVDICADGCLNPDELRKAISSRTAAIIPVHMFGKPAKVNIIGEIATKHDLTVIEDAAHALGSTHQSCQIGG